MRRALLCLLFCLCAASALAGSPRLDAMVEDGLLLDDVWADHLWPGSLAGRDNRITIQASDALESGSHDGFAVSATLAPGPGERLPWLRVLVSDESILGRSHGWAGVQTGIEAGDVAVGVAAMHEAGSSSSREEGLRCGVGVRWAPRADVVLDLAHEWGRARSSGDDFGSDALRGRIHAAVRPGVVFVAAASRDPWACDHLGRSRHEDGDEAIRYEAGLLLWPDADAQLLMVWVRDDLTSDHVDWWCGERWTKEYVGEGVRVSCEARISYWWTWRVGLETVDYEADDVRRRTFGLGTGVAVHAGRWDLSVAFSRRTLPTGADAHEQLACGLSLRF